jgi:hypothetical protein
MGVILTYNSSKDAAEKVVGRIEVAGGYII